VETAFVLLSACELLHRLSDFHKIRFRILYAASYRRSVEFCVTFLSGSRILYTGVIECVLVPSILVDQLE
jgi:hypothetical protein